MPGVGSLLDQGYFRLVLVVTSYMLDCLQKFCSVELTFIFTKCRENNACVLNTISQQLAKAPYLGVPRKRKS
eukprot:5004732-Pyramimonas_sp.AAC.1